MISCGGTPNDHVASPVVQGAPETYPELFTHFFKPVKHYRIYGAPYLDQCTLMFDSTQKAMLLFQAIGAEAASLKSASFTLNESGILAEEFTLQTREEDQLSTLHLSLLPDKSVNYFWEGKITQPSIQQEYAYKPGMTFPDLPLVNTRDSLNLNLLKGHPVVINWWATGCAPCKLEIPGLNTLVEKYPEIYFISIVNDEENLNAFLKETPFAYTHFHGQAEHEQVLGQSYPRNIVLDSQGTILYNAKGANKNTYLLIEGILQKL